MMWGIVGGSDFALLVKVTIFVDLWKRHSPLLCHVSMLNTLRTGDADLRFYVTTVQDG